jgi:hypothetical protein
MIKHLALALGLGMFLLSGSVVMAATDPADACKDAKLKTTGKKASGVLKALGKNIKKPNPAKLGSDISKAQSKMTKGFVKAEGKGGCDTTGDVGAVEAKVDAFALDVIGELSPSPSGAFLDAPAGALD